MPQLDAHDAAFLYSDTTHSNANVSLIHIYDQSTAPGGKVRFKTILAHIESRLHRSPVFRRKLQRVPLELDFPYWIDDPNFDLEYHVRHIALPKPGDWRQFCIQASRIHARPLDLNRPLWEIYVIEGLDSFLDLPEGSFALLTKVHHAAIDVEHGAEIAMLLHDAVAGPLPAEPPVPWFPADGPGKIAMICRGVVNTVTSPLRLAGPLGRALRRVAPAALSLAGDMIRHPDRLPVTRFNSAVSPHRVFETRRFTLEEFKSIRRLVDGATVNDAVLAVCGGALRRYLQAQAELPASELLAIAPIYIRDADAEPGSPPEVSWLHVGLGTDIEDPVRRLRHVRRQTRSSDKVARAIGARELTDVGRHAPAATLAVTSKMLGRVTLGLGRHAPLANCTVTNVPGPSVPLYLCGARMTYFSAIMPIYDGMGLVFAVTSYDGRIVISPTSCRELVPDPEDFAQCLRDSFQEYLAAARRPTKAAKGKGAVRRPRARASAAGKAAPTRLAA
jgi:WS/DGAT/MGAT family acyltransferase